MAKPNVKSLIKNLNTALEQDTPPEKCYEFKTEKREFMEIFSGEMEFQLKDSQDWETIKDGMSFYVPKNSSFKVKIKKLVNYCCSYLDE